MPLRAVIFDYGMVLTCPPDQQAHAELVRITGMPAGRLDELYWEHRPAFDCGALTGREYWRSVTREAGVKLPEMAIDELVQWDARMWMTIDPAMLAWQGELKQRGVRTAIVSNLGDTVHQAMVREFGWLEQFDVLVWSYELGMIKPDPAIYRYALEKLGTRPEETLFIDDKRPNVDAAIALGMKAVEFTTVEKLREELGQFAGLPLPRSQNRDLGHPS